MLEAFYENEQRQTNMKQFLLIIFFTTAIIIPIFSQVDTTSSLDALIKQGHEKARENKSRKFGCTIFGGLGKGGNDIASGFAAGGSIKAHSGIHTINFFAANANSLGYHGGQSSNPTLQSSYYGLTYGVGAYDKNISASIGGGLGYSFVNMSTGGGINYYDIHYQKYSPCLGGQFSAHGKYIGFGIQTYFNLTSPTTDYVLLFGLEVGLN